MILNLSESEGESGQHQTETQHLNTCLLCWKAVGMLGLVVWDIPVTLCDRLE